MQIIMENFKQWVDHLIGLVEVVYKKNNPGGIQVHQWVFNYCKFRNRFRKLVAYSCQNHIEKE